MPMSMSMPMSMCMYISMLSQQEPTRYTGLFRGPAAIEGIVRLSSAIEPPAFSATVPAALRATLRLLGGDLGVARLFPCVAFKAPRARGAPSGNLLFGGRKVGQASGDFFASPLSTVMTEKARARPRRCTRWFPHHAFKRC